VAVPPEVALEAVDRPRQGRELRVAPGEVPPAPFDPPEPLVGALELAMPQVPCGVLERLLQFSGAVGVQAS
jgi:hypothetical protein